MSLRLVSACCWHEVSWQKEIGFMIKRKMQDANTLSRAAHMGLLDEVDGKALGCHHRINGVSPGW